MNEREPCVPSLPHLLAAAPFVLGLVAFAGDAREVSLTWQLRKGEVLRYRYSTEQSAVHAPDARGVGEPSATRQAERIDYRLTVVDSDPASGAARVQCRFDQVGVDLEQLVIGSVHWDSRRPEDLPRADEPTVRPYAHLVGQEFSFLIDRTGAVSDVRGLDRLRAAVLEGLTDSPFAQMTLGQEFGDRAVSSRLTRGFSLAPGALLAPGQGRSRSFEEPIPLLGTLHYDLMETLRRLEGGRAELSLAIRLTRAVPREAPESDPLAARTVVDFGGGTGTGDAVFDLASGHLVRSSMAISMTLTSRALSPIAPPSGPGAASVETAVTETATLELLPN